MKGRRSAARKKWWSCGLTSLLQIQLNRDDVGLKRPGDPGIARKHDHIDFGANAKVGKVNAWLNSKPGSRQETTVIVRFVVVHIHARAVDRLAKAMPRSMKDLRSIARLLENARGCAIDLPPP